MNGGQTTASISMPDTRIVLLGTIYSPGKLTRVDPVLGAVSFLISPEVQTAKTSKGSGFLLQHAFHIQRKKFTQVFAPA